MPHSSLDDSSYGRVYHNYGHRHFSHHAHSQRSRAASPLSSYDRSSEASESHYEAKTRLRWILSLGLLLPALAAIIGVVAWAVSAEVVIGARRDSALRASDTFRSFPEGLHDHEEDFANDQNGHQDRSAQSNNKILHNQQAASEATLSDQQQKPKMVKVNQDDIDQNESLKTAINNAIRDSGLTGSSARNASVYFLSGIGSASVQRATQSAQPETKAKKSAGAQVAEMIDRLVAQRKSSSKGGSPHIVVVAPLRDSKKGGSTTTTTRPESNQRKTGSRSQRRTTTSTTPLPTKEAKTTTKAILSKDADTLMAAAKMLAAHHKISLMRSDSVDYPTYSFDSDSLSKGFESANLVTTNNKVTLAAPTSKPKIKKVPLIPAVRQITSPLPPPIITAPEPTQPPHQFRKYSPFFNNNNNSVNPLSRMGAGASSQSQQGNGNFVVHQMQAPQLAPQHIPAPTHAPNPFSMMPHGPLLPHHRPFSPLPFGPTPPRPISSPPPTPPQFQHRFFQPFPQQQQQQHQQQQQQHTQQFQQPQLQQRQHQNHQQQHHAPQGQQQNNQQQFAQQSAPQPQIQQQFPPNGYHFGPPPPGHPHFIPGQSPPPPPMGFHQGPPQFMNQHQQQHQQQQQQQQQHQHHQQQQNNQQNQQQQNNAPEPSESQDQGIRFGNQGEDSKPVLHFHAADVSSPHDNPNDKGLTLHFGGGPVGGGGQIMTSPVGIFKTLLLPLLPKPRMNLNGKVVFGVVLENGIGFGKQKHKPVPFRASHLYG